MNPIQILSTIFILAFGTLVTRATPFLLFSEGKSTPAYVKYLGRVLPGAVIGLLVVYCLKNVSPLVFPYGLPEVIAIAAIVAMQLWKRNSLLSIGLGTAIYMILVQSVYF